MSPVFFTRTSHNKAATAATEVIQLRVNVSARSPHFQQRETFKNQAQRP